MAAAAAPGARAFGLSAAGNVVASSAHIAQWGLLAYSANLVMQHTSIAPTLVCWWIGLIVVAIIGRIYSGWAQKRGERLVALCLQQQLARTLLPSTPQRQARMRSSEGATALIEHTKTIAEYHSSTAPLHISAPVEMILILIVAAVVYWPVAIVLCLATAMMPANMILAGRAAEARNREQLTALTELSMTVLDNFKGLSVLKRFGAARRQVEVIRRSSERLGRSTELVLRQAFVSSAIMDVLVTFGIAVCATYVGFALLGYVTIPGAPMDLFRGLYVLILCPLFFAPIQQMAAGYHQREKAIAAAELLAPVAVRVDEPKTGAAVRAPKGHLKLQHVVFSYDAQVVLNDISMDIPSGEWTVITGSSGAGKSTLLSLIAGMHEPQSGTILWGTQPPSIDQISWIGQRTVILEGTLKENILLGNTQATDAQVERAAERAGLTSLLARLDDGLDARVGESGYGVSAGEARRIAIARAFLADRPLWILDEPTAHLDDETEEAVLDALQKSTENKTVVVVTHSPLVARKAGALWSIEQGALTKEEMV